MGRDLVFGLKLKTDQFENGMKGASGRLKELASTKLDHLKRQLDEVAKSGNQVSTAKMRELSKEYKELTKVAAAAAGGAKFAAPKINLPKPPKIDMPKVSAPSAITNMAAGALAVPFAKLAAVAATAAASIGGVYAAVSTVKDSLADNAAFEGTKAKFEAFTGSADRARGILNSVRDLAIASGQDIQKSMEGAAALMPAAGGSKAKLLEMMKVAQTLAALKPEQGMEGAATAINEVIGNKNDLISIVERFQIPKQLLQEAAAKGLEGAAMINAALQKMGVTGLVDKMANSFQGRMATIKTYLAELRRNLGEGLFNAINAKLGSVTEWIRNNGQYGMDVARGLGIMLAEKFQEVQASVAGTITGLQSVFATVKGYGGALFEWIKQIPGKLVEAFNNGSLVQFFAAYVGGLMQMAWEALRTLGALAMAGITSGLPALKHLIGKAVIDVLQGALGPRVSKALGLDGASARMGEIAKTKGSEFAQVSGEILKSGAARMGAVGMNIKDVAGDFFGNNMGFNAAMERGAAATKAAQKSVGPGLLGEAYQKGHQVRVVEEMKAKREEEAHAAREAAKPKTPKALTADEQNRMDSLSKQTFSQNSMRSRATTRGRSNSHSVPASDGYDIVTKVRPLSTFPPAMATQ